MHSAIYEALGLSYRYVSFQVDPEDVPECLSTLKRLGYIGLNVTIPLKQEVLLWCQTVDPFASKAQAANTLNLKERSCINTDAPGFLGTLQEYSFPAKTALVLGAGGSARALVLALVADGWHVHIYNRTATTAEQLASVCGAKAVDSADPAGAYLILNTTAASLQGHSPPVIWPRAERQALAYDLMYSKAITPFLGDAHKYGLAILDGKEMLVAQGALSFHWWTGLVAPLDVMRQVVYQEK
jgi:shikimate dehydrogenase